MKKLFYILLFFPLVGFSQVNSDSLWNIWNNSSKNDTVRLDAIHNHNWRKYVFYKTDSAIYYAKTQYQFAQSKNQKKYIADALNQMGSSSSLLSNYDDAIDYFKQSLTVFEKLNNEKGIANSLNNIALVLEKKGNFHQAIQSYTESLKIREKINDKVGVATSFNNIGIIYQEMGEHDKALNFYKKSSSIHSETKNKQGLSQVYNNMGSLFDHKLNVDSALIYYFKSLRIKKEIKDRNGLASIKNNIGNIYLKLGKLDSASLIINESLKLSQSLSNKRGEANSLFVLSSIKLAKGEVHNALKLGHRSFSIANEIGANVEKMKISFLLFKINKNLKNFENSLKNYELSISIRDSLNSEKNQKSIISQHFKYEYEKKEAVLDAEHKVEIEKQHTLALAEQKEQNIIITFIFIVLIIVASFLVYIFKRLRITKKQRNKIYKQKEQIEIVQKETESQKLIIEEAHTEIKDSINYAKRLQKAILPALNDINSSLPNSFIYYNPKDVVSGDFYWFEKIDDTIFIAAADCTGHGVPGAMVSVVCSNALNRSVNEFGIKEPAKILDKTRELVIATFAKSGEEVKDGMDISLCVFKKNKVTFSGANNPLWIVRETNLLTERQREERSTVLQADFSLIEFKGNKQPIGLYQNSSSFNQIDIELFENDKLYLFTDGYADQFGGEKGKKFKYRPFKKLLLNLTNETMENQQQLLADEFNSWKGDFDQIDDVCVIGITKELV